MIWEEFESDPVNSRYNYLSAGTIDAETWLTYPVTVGKLVSRYYELWTKNVIAKVSLSTEIDVAYGYSNKSNEIRGFKFERYHEGVNFMKRLKDPSISHIYYKRFEEPTARNIPIVFIYFYLAKVNFGDEIVCLQEAEEVDGTKIFLPLSFKHTEPELMIMWYHVLNMRFNLLLE